MVVNSVEFGEEWPYFPEQLRLVCDDDYALVLENGVSRYALNGNARRKGYPPASSLARSDIDYSLQLALARERAWDVYERKYGIAIANILGKYGFCTRHSMNKKRTTLTVNMRTADGLVRYEFRGKYVYAGDKRYELECNFPFPSSYIDKKGIEPELRERGLRLCGRS